MILVLAEQAKRLQIVTVHLLREEPLEILSEEDFVAEREASNADSRKWKPLIPNRLRVWLKNTPGKKKGHIVSGQTFISDSGMMMIINARLSYTETRPEERVQKRKKKFTPGGDECRC